MNPSPRPPPRLALPALLLGAVGIGFAPIFVRWSETGPVATAFWRMALSLPVLLAWLAWERAGSRAAARAAARANMTAAPRTVAPDTVAPDTVTPVAAAPAASVPASTRWRLALAGLFFAADLGVWHWSIRFTSVANATLLANLAPIFVALGAWIFLRQRPTARFALALAIALAGTWTLLADSAASAGSRPLLGDLLGTGAAVFYAGYILSVADVRRRFSTATVMSVGGAAACLPLLAVAALSGEALLPATTAGWLTLGGLALVSQVAGQSLIAYALAHLPAGFSSLTLLMQPLCAAVFAWALLAEPLGAQQALGGAVVLLGVLLARRSVR